MIRRDEPRFAPLAMVLAALVENRPRRTLSFGSGYRPRKGLPPPAPNSRRAKVKAGRKARLLNQRMA